MTAHPCQQCGVEIETGDLCKQCFIDDQIFSNDEDCGQCDGSGYTYDCIDGCCVNAEDGCHLCEQRCDFCNPPTVKQVQADAELRQVLTDALNKTQK